MNWFDAVVVALVVVAVVIGFRSGALPQLCGLAGAVLGGVLSILAVPYLEQPLESVDAQLRAFLVLGLVLFAVGIGEAIGSAIGRTAASRLGEGLFGAVDRVLGAVVGGAQAVLVFWLASGLLAAGPSPTLATQAQTSTFVRAMNAYLPAPTEIATALSRLLGETGLPDLFVGLEPLPAPPVSLPDDPLVRDLAALAVPSTVKVSAATCQTISSGTGFVVEPGYVVTNAHVVAGADTVRVGLDGDAYDAAPVHFDPDLDIALLYAPGLPAPALSLAQTDPTRGAIGATLGFPGGGALAAVPAAVASSYPARGLDIYGDQRVTRAILELRAQIDQGDSGGPLILSDGTVGGVVFAEARTDPGVGYALTPSSVRDAIAPALGRTGLVPVGHCIH
ncbi:MAG TPA: MarP family serine protease [Candidatus Limnocylindrales bacterium]|nr:MarP family serine protease [Candidatus Limnocylindrales bacterium]